MRLLFGLLRLSLSKALVLIRKDSFSRMGQVEVLFVLFRKYFEMIDYYLHVLSLSSERIVSYSLTAMGSMMILCLLLEDLSFLMIVSKMATLP
jgi:hypothetical protein